ncbi:hypothetical protein RchiOBHm_Chr4g0391721 [Rosa chinensis]|uniref:Uncharacterized protein n=1 Tax=Rosa chinensis TaxID=74649 RepID=A0A2P6QQK1_ROSCH|nr:hypothetical protein RchiOBHm_Chr4g0391721 [Rosa chinensis]
MQILHLGINFLIADDMLGILAVKLKKGSALALWAVKTRKVYTQDELDEVRIEVADYLQTLL